MIVARHVTGTVIRYRSYVRYLLLAIFFGTPWLQYNGRQALLFDIGNHKVSFFFPGFIIWPQENIFLMFSILLLGLAMFLFTALVGRIWCGWTCPQTIYVELFDEIGRLLFPSKYGKRSATMFHKSVVHFVWIILSMASAFHFIGFFHPIREMGMELITEGPMIFAHYVWPYFVFFSGALFYGDIGFFREQFCVYLCPYARFQSVMLDDDSIVISYNSVRGEPRRKTGAAAKEAPQTIETQAMDVKSEGDCTNCNMCVLVCPTGIDIREGLQVSCINCGHCIDACTKEMEKFDKKSLVNYESERYAHTGNKAQYVRARTIIYSILMVFITSIFTYFGVTRVPLHFYVRRQPGVEAQNIQGKVVNYYRMYMGNISEDNVTVNLRAETKDPTIQNIRILGTNDFSLDSNGEQKFDNIMVEADVKEGTTARFHKIDLILSRSDEPDSIKRKEVNFLLPK